MKKHREQYGRLLGIKRKSPLFMGPVDGNTAQEAFHDISQNIKDEQGYPGKLCGGLFVVNHRGLIQAERIFKELSIYEQETHIDDEIYLQELPSQTGRI